ncbi:MAG: sodium ion-translocating decarboxylase subunit beta [Chloroflexi bacterium]|nr:sodium ion-translocating decarboxylase subunit beta [Chloroflexota bacterium]
MLSTAARASQRSRSRPRGRLDVPEPAPDIVATLLQITWKWIGSTGIVAFSFGNLFMIAVGFFLIYLGIKGRYEPFLLVPIGVGAMLANIPNTGLMDEGGLLRLFYTGVQLTVLPPLIFLGVGAMTDFGPLIANPGVVLFGAAAHIGIFVALMGAKLLGFNIYEAGAIGIIGGADGPMAIYVASKLAPHLLGQVAVAAYSYMALLPLIQPPIMRLLTTEAERKVSMKQLRPVSQRERILFPIIMLVFVNALLPPIAPLVSMFMLGNLLRVSGVVERLSQTASGALLDIVTIFLVTGIGATMSADNFFNLRTAQIVVLGLIAFATGTAGGVLAGKVACKLSGGKINPLIGSAGIAAVPMAARVSHLVAFKANPRNLLVMHAMGPNIAGVFGTAAAGSIMLTLLGY